MMYNYVKRFLRLGSITSWSVLNNHFLRIYLCGGGHNPSPTNINKDVFIASYLRLITVTSNESFSFFKERRKPIMSTILFKENKQLVLTKDTKIRQNENAVDKLEFLIPTTINDIDMVGFSATLLFVDQANVSHMEQLVLSGDTEDGLYKDSWYRYILPVTSEFTKMAGTLKMELTLTKYVDETETSYVMHSSELEMSILTWEDYYKFVPATSLNAVDEKLLAIDNELAKMNSIAEFYGKSQAVDLMLTDDTLQLKNSNGEAMGDGVEILVDTSTDPDSNPNDAEIDLDEVTGGETTENAINTSLLGRSLPVLDLDALLRS